VIYHSSSFAALKIIHVRIVPCMRTNEKTGIVEGINLEWKNFGSSV
jgi:hypothetical protein